MKKNFTLLLMLFAIVFSLSAQEISNDVEMADQMRAEGKIYVVIAVVLIVFFGLILYLVSLDRKISKIENEKSGI